MNMVFLHEQYQDLDLLVKNLNKYFEIRNYFGALNNLTVIKKNRMITFQNQLIISQINNGQSQTQYIHWLILVVKI